MSDKSLKRTVLAISAISSFLTPFMGSSINIALPAIGKELSMNAVSMSWVSTAYIVAAAVFLVPMGRVADIIGRKKIFLSGIIIFTISSFLLGLSNSEMFLISIRVLQGMGGAMVFGTGTAIVTSVFAPGERGKAIGITVASVYIGLAAGPFIGGVLTEHFGWRSIFLSIVPLGLILITLILTKLKQDWKEAKGEKFDFSGTIIYCLSMFSLMYGFSVLPKIFGFLFIIMSIIGLIIFVEYEKKINNPVLNVKLFYNNKIFAYSNLAALINYSATFGVTFILSLYLQYIKVLSPKEAGLILIIQPLIQAFLSPIAGILSDKTEPRIVATLGMVLTVAGLSLLIFINSQTSLLFIIIGLILLGIGFAFFSTSNTNAIMNSVEKKFYGVASGTVGTMRLTGQMFSMGIVILVFALNMGNVKITPDKFDSFILSCKSIFSILAILCFVGIFASFARGKVK